MLSFPDFYANYNGTLWGFEHFEFDDTCNVNKKGSSFRRTNADIKRFKGEIDDPQVLLAGKCVIIDHFVRYYIDNVNDAIPLELRERIQNMSKPMQIIYPPKKKLV